MRIPVALSTILIGSLLAGASPAALEPLPKAPPRPIARVWKGKTRAAVADEYQAYLEASGVAKIRATPGNLGVDVFRRTEGEETEFAVTSFWESVDAVKRFAGENYRKAVVLPRDRRLPLDRRAQRPSLRGGPPARTAVGPARPRRPFSGHCGLSSIRLQGASSSREAGS